ncbi:unnamed protein product [Caenorhabditis sp. 36 PRJEB53466]|nr:unnamed protein product [Caenorhabditis sp. 36 PRJEB53466]
MVEEEEADRELIELLDKYSHDAPSSFFEYEPTKESTTVRTQHFALKSIVSQLRIPINTEAEAVTKWIVYKQSGPHRHQKFFGHFRHMNRLLRKYNDMALVKRLNGVLKKAENCGDDLYLLSPSALRYMGCAYVARVYRLERIRETAVNCADGAMGLLELEHWTNLCLVIVAVCAQVHSEVVAQLLEMEKTYKTGAGVFRTVDAKFPFALGDLKVAEKLKKDSGAFDNRKVNFAAVSRLLKYSEQKMEDAQTEIEMKVKRSEVLTELLSTELDLTPTAPRKAVLPTPTPTIDMTDLGISISREDLSFLNSTVQSASTTILEDVDEGEDDILMSPNLFAPKNARKKRKMEKTPKKIPKASFLASTISLLDDKSERKKKKKQLKKIL